LLLSVFSIFLLIPQQPRFTLFPYTTLFRSKGLAFVGAATVATPAAANTVPSQSEWSPEQISKLEEIVKNFITNAQASNIQPLDSCARLMGHGSHNNEGSRARAAPATRTAPTRK